MNIRDFSVQERSGRFTDRYTDITVAKTQELYAVAKIALEIANRWGCVAAMPDGEDSAGRSKLRMQTPDEIAARAFDTAAALWTQFEGRGWLSELPMPKKMPSKETEDA